MDNTIIKMQSNNKYKSIAATESLDAASLVWEVEIHGCCGRQIGCFYY